MCNVYKGYRVLPHDQYPMWVVKPLGQGQVSDSLRGMYTSIEQARRGIDSVEDSKTPSRKRIKNVKSDSTSRG